MRYFKLSMDMNRSNDVVCHYENNYGIQQNVFHIGKKYLNGNEQFKFVFDENEGKELTDYLANDKGWFVVSAKFKNLLEKMNTDIQFLKVEVLERSSQRKCDYYIANILRLVDALSLEDSDYFETDIPQLGKIYTVSRFAICKNKVQNSDVFKLANRQEIPIFVSNNFKRIIEENEITGIALREVKTV